jgi:penicillin-binding protein 1B
LARVAVGSTLASLALLGAVCAWLWFFEFLPWYEPIRDDTVRSADAHASLSTSHPGWSFQARVWSAATPYDIPPERRIFEARARGYTEACPPVAPGQYCRGSGAISLRGGHFPEGDQPGGNDGWTRPLAFEPVLIGWLVGPDSELREHLPLDSAPKALISALIAGEDERFWQHRGVDPTGLLRAAWIDWQTGDYSQGASTLDMQLVRNLTGEKRRSVGRKLQEMARAYTIDAHLGKEKVLQLYLDAPYLGQLGTYSIGGFREAARYYYGVDVDGLTLGQTATLVGILPAPGNLSPDKHPDLAKEKRDRVLKRMAALGWDAGEIASALAEPIAATPTNVVPPERYPAYLAATREALLAALPPGVVYGAGLDVFTALDPVVQDETERVFSQRTPFLDKLMYGRGQGPLIAAGAIVDPWTGRLVAAHDTAIVDSNGFDRVTQMRRQAGSAFKPIVYGLAFMPGPDGKPLRTPDDTVPDEPRSFGTRGVDLWSPRNANGWYMTKVTLARAMAWSLNIPSANLLEEIGGPEPLIGFAQRVGFDTAGFPHERGLALGQAEVTPVEMARYVATVVNGGRKVSASPLAIAIDAFGRTRYENPVPSDQVMTPEAALYTRELMRLVVTQGTGWSVHGRHGVDGYHGEIIGKTGTASDDKDVWFIGSTPYWSGAVWVGYELPAAVGGHSSEVAAPLFGWWMDAIHEGLDSGAFDTSRVTRRWVCANTGLGGNATCPGIQMPFLDGATAKGGCPVQHPPTDLAPPPVADAAAAAPPVPVSVPVPAPAPGASMRKSSGGQSLSGHAPG